MTSVALRMDDVGAASKRYEVYSNWSAGIGPLRVSGNWLFLKYLKPFKAWGPYAELTAAEWVRICRVLDDRRAKLTVAVTAAWVEAEDRLVPFNERFPDAAAAMRDGVRAGLIEIANHGLTHCVLSGGAYRPRWFSSNRSFHREFWDWVPAEVHASHLERSQAILEGYFGGGIVTFVPPGNVFTDRTLEEARRHGLRYVSCAVAPGVRQQMTVVGNERVVPFHDRDLVLGGVDWLVRTIDRMQPAAFCFVRDLASTRSIPASGPA
jgi:peptidoglycan/xylan/chitin deacetylase (PgdA/CDA1 family)